MGLVACAQVAFAVAGWWGRLGHRHAPKTQRGAATQQDQSHLMGCPDSCSQLNAEEVL